MTSPNPASASRAKRRSSSRDPRARTTPREIDDRATDIANAERLVREHGANFRHVGALRRDLVWTGTHFERDSTGRLLSLATESARRRTLAALDAGSDVARDAIRAESCRSIEAAVRLARINPRVAARPSDLDRDPLLFNSITGTIDLETLRVRRHRREDLITKISRTPFDRSAECPQWLKFLDEVMAGRQELVRHLQRWAGYALTGSVREHALLFLIGTGRNGKGVFLRILSRVMGPDYAGAAAPGLLLARRRDEHPTELADLVGKRLVVVNEVPARCTFNEERLKLLTGADPVKGRGMREDFSEFSPTHKFVIAANHRPAVRDDSPAFWSRIQVVDFPVSFEGKEDRNLEERLMLEAPGILVWMARGAVEVLHQGLGKPPSVNEEVERYRVSADVMGRFLAEHPGDWMASALLAEFNRWAETQHEQSISQTELADALRWKNVPGKRRGDGVHYFIGSSDGARGERDVPLNPNAPDSGFPDARAREGGNRESGTSGCSPTSVLCPNCAAPPGGTHHRECPRRGSS